MPIPLRLSLLFNLVTLLGFSLIVCANFENSWDAFAYLAGGLIMSTIGAISTLILSGISMIKKGPWRRFSLIEVIISLILVVCLALLWRWPNKALNLIPTGYAFRASDRAILCQVSVPASWSFIGIAEL